MILIDGLIAIVCLTGAAYTLWEKVQVSPVLTATMLLSMALVSIADIRDRLK